MGFGVESFYFLKYVEIEHNIKLSGKVVDFGSQEYDTKSKKNNFLVENYAKNLSTFDMNSGAHKGPLGNLLKEIGVKKYVSFDIDGRFGAIPIDFNATNEKYFNGDADFVLNLGTSEHVFDQSEIFRMMHHSLKTNGIFYHVLPYHNYIDHGLFTYSPCFFYSLALYNKYDIISMYVNSSASKENFYNIRDSKKIEGRSNILVLMRKTSDIKFVKPLQVNNPMIVLPQFERGEFSRDELKIYVNHNNCSFTWDPTNNKKIPLKKLKLSSKNIDKKINFSLILMKIRQFYIKLIN